MSRLEIVLFILFFPLFFFVGYRFFFLLVYLFKKEKHIPLATMNKKFAIIIPAYNEEVFISKTISNILEQNYPRSLFDMIVIADNCSDRTFEIASQFNIKVFERTDEVHKGKGFVIKWIIDKIDLSDYDAIIISDADTYLTKTFLQEINKSLQSGANVIQSYYAMSNPKENLFTIFFSITNTIRNLFCFWAKWKCGLSVPLVGSGMCFDRVLLKQLNWNAFSITEDHEYYAFLADRNIRVDFSPAAKVLTHHSSSFHEATSQRLRWYGGKFISMYRYGFKLLIKGIQKFNIMQFDAGIELIMPHMALLLNINLVGIIIVSMLDHHSTSDILLIALLISLCLQFVYFLSGVYYNKNFVQSLLSLILMPIILIWGVTLDILAFLGFRKNRWIRTQRNI